MVDGKSFFFDGVRCSVCCGLVFVVSAWCVCIKLNWLVMILNHLYDYTIINCVFLCVLFCVCLLCVESRVVLKYVIKAQKI